MEILDAQLHIWEDRSRRHYNRPWDENFAFPWGAPWSIERALATMDAAGVDAAVLALPPNYRTTRADGHHRYDSGYAQEAVLRYPKRFGYVAHHDHHDPEIDALLAATLAHPGALGTRVLVRSPEEWRDFEAGLFTPYFAAAARHGVPLMIFVSGRPAAAAKIARAHPDLNLIIDHLGLKQPPRMVPDAEPFQQLPDLLALAQFPHVSVKLTGMPALSREAYPYDDLWPHYARLIDAFGIERLIWGSDITRVAELVNYADALGYVKYAAPFSASDKAKLLGGNLRRILNWRGPLGDRL